MRRAREEQTLSGRVATSTCVSLDRSRLQAPVAAALELQGCDFARLWRQWAEIDDSSSFVKTVHALAGDPNGYSLVDLGTRSRLACFGASAHFGVTDYGAAATNGNHHGAHRYLVSNTMLGADVILNLPKLQGFGRGLNGPQSSPATIASTSVASSPGRDWQPPLLQT
jgi:hypothetical protein